MVASVEGGDGGTRTPTDKPHDPKSCASANSATSPVDRAIIRQGRLLDNCQLRAESGEGSGWIGADGSGAVGSIKLNVLPMSGRLSTVIVVPILSRISLAIASPTPVPPKVRVVLLSTW